MKSLQRFLAIAVLPMILLGQGCTRAPSPETQRLSKRVTLKVWGVVDDADAYQTFFTAFRRSHPYVDIQFKRYRLEEYEDEILNALSEDRGPDVFLIHNTWTDKYLPKILSAPKTLQAAFQVATGGQNQQVTYETRTIQMTSPRSVRNDFADVVAKDTLRRVNVAEEGKEPLIEERIVAMPLSVDTLALYYNKDLLNAAGIATPPETWDQFQAQAKRITRYGEDGKIVRSGAGIGLGSNVERAGDVVSLLMMQNGAEMADDAGNPRFSRMPQALSGTREEPPGIQALRFYSDFANPSKDAYAWSPEQPNSLDAFIQGTSAFFLGYSYHLPLVRARAPKLNLGITKAPQIAGNPEANFANYWMWAVAKKSKAPDVAWLFVNELTGKDGADGYVKTAKRPAARKALLDTQLEDEDAGVFASQVLTSKSWYRGVDPRSAERAIVELLDVAPTAADDDELSQFMKIAEEKVGQTIK